MKHLTLTGNDYLEIEKSLSTELIEYTQLAWPELDPADPYVDGWHMHAICEHLEAVARGEVRRLLMNVPPGTSKSSLTAIYFPSWLWGPFGWPSCKVIGASHEQDLAIRDNRKNRLLVESEWYQTRWPTKLTTDQNEKKFFENQSRGWRQATAVKSMTGRRGDVVIWDDPLSPEKAYSDIERETANRVFAETLPTRLINPSKSAIIIIMQRLHEDDVSGYILARDLGYEHLMLPMEFELARRCHTVVLPRYMESRPVMARRDPKTGIWYSEDAAIPTERRTSLEQITPRKVYAVDPREAEGELLCEARFPRHVVDADKKTMGLFATAGQFQQSPTPRGGALFQKQWFKFLPAKPAGIRWVRAWDLAATDDENAAWTRGALVGLRGDASAGFEVIIGDVVGIQGTPAAVDALILSTAKTDGHGIPGSLPQDPGQAGKSQVTALVRKLVGYDYTFSPESGDKVTRARPLAAQAEAGNLYLVEGEWNAALVEEFSLFPRGKWADQVDACSRGLNYLLEKPDYSSGTVDFRL